MAWVDEARALIEAKKFEDLEAMWMSRLESDPSDIEDFVATAKLLRKADERSRADALLGLLGDSLKENKLWLQRLAVLKEVVRLAKHPANFRKEIEEAVTNSFSARPSFKRAMDAVKFTDPTGNPLEKAERVETMLTFDVGECFFMTGRGSGTVVELNPELGVCRLDFDKEKRVSVPLGAAQKFLIPLPPGHLLRERIDSPENATKNAVAKPGETFARLLQSFGRPMTAGEIKDAMTGIVPDAKWSSWWTSARKHPQILVGGAGARANYSWNASTEVAEQRILSEFDAASPRNKLELARKHSSRSGELADHFSSALASEAKRISKSDPALAWEIIAILEKLPGKYTLEIDQASLLSGQLASRVVAAIPDRQLRERAIASVLESHPEWPKVFGELFFLEEDPRILTLIADTLEKRGMTEIRDRLIDETLRYARRHPRAFHWYLKTASESATLPPKANYALLFQMLDALTHDEFGAVKARIREFFDAGGLAIRIINNSADEEQARKLVDILERYGVLEEYRREIVRGAAMMKHPTLREPQAEPIYATDEAFRKKRDELEHLRKVEIPANSKALQVAREMGDLRENFEYKAARQRAEYLAALVGKLQSELSRVRVLNPSDIDTSEVRIGTKVGLSNGDQQRVVTILGPWESAPEHGVYSNQSEAAKALIGRHSGEIVSFMGNDYEIVSITTWK